VKRATRLKKFMAHVLRFTFRPAFSACIPPAANKCLAHGKNRPIPRIVPHAKGLNERIGVKTDGMSDVEKTNGF